jgi:hypothetical protein
LNLPKIKDIEQVGNGFFSFNPIGASFLEQLRENKRQVTSTDIAKLDKQEEITTFEVSFVSRIMTKLREKVKVIFDMFR